MSSGWAKAAAAPPSKNKFNRSAATTNSTASPDNNKNPKANPSGLSTLQTLSSSNSSKKRNGGGLFGKRKALIASINHNHQNQNDSFPAKTENRIPQSPPRSVSPQKEKECVQDDHNNLNNTVVMEEPNVLIESQKDDCKLQLLDEDLDLDEVLFSALNHENQEINSLEDKAAGAAETDEKTDNIPPEEEEKESESAAPTHNNKDGGNDFSWENIIVQHHKKIAQRKRVAAVATRKSTRTSNNKHQPKEKNAVTTTQQQPSLSVLKTRPLSLRGKTTVETTLQPLATKRKGKSRMFGPKQAHEKITTQPPHQQETGPVFDSWVQETVAFLNLSILPPLPGGKGDEELNNKETPQRPTEPEPLLLSPFLLSSPGEVAAFGENEEHRKPDRGPMFLNDLCWTTPHETTTTPPLEAKLSPTPPDIQQLPEEPEAEAPLREDGAATEADAETSVCTNGEEEEEPLQISELSEPVHDLSSPEPVDEHTDGSCNNSCSNHNNFANEKEHKIISGQDSPPRRRDRNGQHPDRKSTEKQPIKENQQQRRRVKRREPSASMPSGENGRNNERATPPLATPLEKGDSAHNPKSRRRPRSKKLPPKSETRYALEQLQPAAPPVPKPAICNEELSKRLFEMEVCVKDAPEAKTNVDTVTPATQSESASLASCDEIICEPPHYREQSTGSPSDSKPTKTSFAAAVRAKSTKVPTSCPLPHSSTATTKTPLSTTAAATTSSKSLSLQQLPTKRRGTSRLLGNPKPQEESSWSHQHCRLVLLSN